MTEPTAVLNNSHSSKALQSRRLREVNTRPASKVFKLLATVVHAFNSVATKRQWLHPERIPAEGPVLIISNHTSYFDTLAIGEFIIWAGRWPRFMGKIELWSTPLVGWLARSTGQIPVKRHTKEASDSLKAAERALVDDSAAIVMYPEGTLTHDPDTWPMTMRTGAARLAMITGTKVVPIAQWGSHKIMPGPGFAFPRFVPRKDIKILCGEAVDLDDLRPLMGTDKEREAILAASVRFENVLTDLLATLRGEQAPLGVRWDDRKLARVPIGSTEVSE